MSIATAKAELFGFLASDSNGTPVSGISSYVTQVYDHELWRRDMLKGTAVTVFSTRLSETDLDFVVRIYQEVQDDPKVTQDNLDNAVWAVDGVLDPANHFIHGDWTMGFDQNIGALVAQVTITGQRTDF